MAEPRCPDAIVLLPGVMGSELRDARGRVVWGMKPGVLFRQLVSRDVLKRLKLKPGAPDDGIRPSGLIAFPSYLPIFDGVEPYTALAAGLRRIAVHVDAVLEFPYDWRRSVSHNAKLLEAAALGHLGTWKQRVRTLPDFTPGQEEPKLTLVCHSMGGLVARYFTEVLGHRDVTRRIVTLGTPFGGSVKAVRLLAHGDILPLGLLADAVRDAARTFPGVYDLLPRFPCVRASTPEPLSASVAGEVGVEPELFTAAVESHRQVLEAAQGAGAGVCPIRPMVGTTQPTLASFRVADGEASFDELGEGDVRAGGDSTVGRDHAYASLTTPAYLPQRHGKLASTEEAVEFVKAVLTERTLGRYQGEGIGVRLPDAAPALRPFDVEIEPAEGETGLATCALFDADSGRKVDQKASVRRAGRWIATFDPRDPGLYLLRVRAGGFSAVEEALLVV